MAIGFRFGYSHCVYNSYNSFIYSTHLMAAQVAMFTTVAFQKWMGFGIYTGKAEFSNLFTIRSISKICGFGTCNFNENDNLNLKQLKISGYSEKLSQHCQRSNAASLQLQIHPPAAQLMILSTVERHKTRTKLTWLAANVCRQRRLQGRPGGWGN